MRINVKSKIGRIFAGSLMVFLDGSDISSICWEFNTKIRQVQCYKFAEGKLVFNKDKTDIESEIKTGEITFKINFFILARNIYQRLLYKVYKLKRR